MNADNGHGSLLERPELLFRIEEEA